MPIVPAPPTVAILAGGKGERIGGEKPTAQLGGRPLISYPLQAASDAGLQAVVVAKHDTKLPPLQVPVIYDVEHRRHPLSGVIAALMQHQRVIALACDMPFIPPTLLRRIAEQAGDAIVTRPGNFMQPFPALYTTRHLRHLQMSLIGQRSLQETLERTRPRIIGDPDLRAFGVLVRVYFSVNTPADLNTAETWLAQPARAAALSSED
jgi:molybdenum cofactor guanylyltransferase